MPTRDRAPQDVRTVETVRSLSDRVWLTHDSAVVVRSLTFAEISPYFELLQPIRLGEEVAR